MKNEKQHRLLFIIPAVIIAIILLNYMKVIIIMTVLKIKKLKI